MLNFYLTGLESSGHARKAVIFQSSKSGSLLHSNLIKRPLNGLCVGHRGRVQALRPLPSKQLSRKCTENRNYSPERILGILTACFLSTDNSKRFLEIGKKSGWFSCSSILSNIL